MIAAVSSFLARTSRWRIASKESSRLNLMRFLSTVSPWLAGAVVAEIGIGAVMPSAFAIATGRAVAALSTPSNLRASLFLLAVVFLLQQIVNPLRAITADALARRFKSALTIRLMQTTLRATSVAYLEDVAILDEVETVKSPGGVDPRLAAIALVNQLATRLQGLVALSLLGFFRWWLPILLLIALIFRERMLADTERQLFSVWKGKVQRLRRAGYLRDLATKPEAAKELRVFGLGEWAVQRFESEWIEAMRHLWQARPDVLRHTAVSSVPIILTQAIAIVTLALAALSLEITVANLMMFSQALLIVTRSLGTYSDDDSRIEAGGQALKTLAHLETRSIAPQFQMRGELSSVDLPNHEIRFEAVEFRYPGRDETILNGLDLVIHAGQSLAVVGENGCGKTTLIKLLARLYDPTSGRITIDGTDLRELEPAGWQRRVATLFQDFERYWLTVTDNVGFGAIENMQDTDSLDEAARRADFMSRIDQLPKGWSTVLNRQFVGGVQLSAGEWQRVALARALFAAVAGAGILVLDEPTAHLDARGEASFYQRFLDLTSGRTTVLISHRFSTLRRADSIVVLDGGRISECGRHEELIARGGYYARMFEAQASRFERASPKSAGVAN